MLSMSIWIFLLITSIAILGCMRLFLSPKIDRIKKETYNRAFKLGLFLVIFDFIFENAGLLAGYWYTSGSVLQLGAVPIEVVGIAFCAGYAYSLLFKEKYQKFNWEIGFFTSLLIAVVGTLIEAILVSQGVLTYTGGWTSMHALISYFITFFIMHKVNSML